MAGAVQEILFIPDFKQGELRNTVLHILPFDPATPIEGQYWYNSTSKTLNFYNGSTVSVLARLNDDTHTHSNKTTLDAITAAFTTALNTKLANIATGATKTASSTTNGNIKINDVETTVYTHPAAHPATLITQDDTHRFVTDAEKTTWSGKQNALGFTPENVANKGVANGYASLDATGKVPSSQIPSSYKECAVVADIAARNAISNKYEGLHVWVVDASGDTTVTAGAAEYIWTGTAWAKLSEAESLDVTVTWSNISGKPTSAVVDIDNAVALKHSHIGKNIGYFSATVGDNTNTSFTLTHNLNNSNPMVVIKRNASPYNMVLAGHEVVSPNSIKVYFKDAPATNEFAVAVYG